MELFHSQTQCHMIKVDNSPNRVCVSLIITMISIEETNRSDHRLKLFFFCLFVKINLKMLSAAFGTLNILKYLNPFC